mmetsp:Transcript_125975/g.364466  ORF Transcript_125975/g.364466 Transcript_125975/m.364466 type:complete len:334 (+) Transcript_125975:1243-2244(+)
MTRTRKPMLSPTKPSSITSEMVVHKRSRTASMLLVGALLAPSASGSPPPPPPSLLPTMSTAVRSVVVMRQVRLLLRGGSVVGHDAPVLLSPPVSLSSVSTARDLTVAAKVHHCKSTLCPLGNHENRPDRDCNACGAPWPQQIGWPLPPRPQACCLPTAICMRSSPPCGKGPRRTSTSTPQQTGLPSSLRMPQTCVPRASMESIAVSVGVLLTTTAWPQHTGVDVPTSRPQATPPPPTAIAVNRLCGGGDAARRAERRAVVVGVIGTSGRAVVGTEAAGAEEGDGTAAKLSGGNTAEGRVGVVSTGGANIALVPSLLPGLLAREESLADAGAPP